MFQRKIKEGYVRNFDGYEPEKLQFFNPGLVAKFIPEALLTEHDDINDVFVTMYSTFQHEDIYKALAYVERNVIPNLKPDNLQKNGAKAILDYIKTIHYYAAATLAIDCNQQAGEYITKNTVRWCKNISFQFELIDTLTKNGRLENLFDKYKLSHLLDPFSKIIFKIKIDKNIVIPKAVLANMKKTVSQERFPAILLLQKLVFGHHQHFFSTDEESVIAQIVKIGMPVEDIPDAMERYAKELLNRLMTCDGTQGKVIPIAAFAFQQLTEIHPFFNGNGRTATALLNAILIVFGFPSILLRTDEEANDSNSAYNQAIKHIMTDISLLEKHIESKLEIAKSMDFIQIKKSFHDRLEKQKDVVELCYKLLWLNQLNLNNSEFNLKLVFQLEKDNMVQNWSMCHRDKISKPLLTKSTARFPYAVTKPNKIDDITQELERITGMSKWKSNTSKGLKIWLPDLEEAIAKDIVMELSVLLKNSTIQVSLKRHDITKKHIVWVENARLESLQMLPTIAHSKSTKLLICQNK